MSGERIGAGCAVFLLFLGCGLGQIYDCIDKERCDKKVDTCTGSVKIFDSSDNLIATVSHTDDPNKKHNLKSKGGKALLEGNCCFEARQRPVDKGGRTAVFKDNKEYYLPFKVKYVIKSDCVPGAGTPWIPIVITVAVVAVLVIIAVIVYANKRNSGHTPVSTQP